MAVRLAGGRPVRLTPRNPRSNRRLDGVIIGGGDDLDPLLYGGDALPEPRHDAARDAFEARTLRRSLKRDIPILGICRGAQLLNVVLGGTLHPDIRGMRRITSNRPYVLPFKTVRLRRGSRLQKILHREKLKVNSLHHQAMDHLGSGLQVVGRDLDGIVQAVEAPRRRFAFGVQWHPEYIPQHKAQRRLFRALVRAAGQVRMPRRRAAVRR